MSYQSDDAQAVVILTVASFLDVLHTTLVWSGLWYYFIIQFQDSERIQDIYW